MKIVRNGVEYELTLRELDAAYRECKHDYFVEDVKSKAEDMGIDLTNKDIDDIADCAEDALSNCDSYYEDYWMCIEDAIEQAGGRL